jgi:hypothetical protein
MGDGMEHSAIALEDQGSPRVADANILATLAWAMPRLIFDGEIGESKIPVAVVTFPEAGATWGNVFNPLNFAPKASA